MQGSHVPEHTQLYFPGIFEINICRKVSITHEETVCTVYTERQCRRCDNPSFQINLGLQLMFGVTRLVYQEICKQLIAYIPSHVADAQCKRALTAQSRAAAPVRWKNP